MGRHFRFFNENSGSGRWASSTKSYHNGGVEGDSFSRWYEKNLASYFDKDDDPKGSGSGGTKGSGSSGTKGSGSGGTKGSGSGGTKGSGSGGTKGSGSGGTKGSGSGGTKGSGSGGTKGSGSGGTKGSGSGGTKGSGSGGTKGSGSGGTKGSGSGGTKGSGSGGTNGSGSGGTKGSGSGGTKGSGSGGTKGSGSGGTKGSGSGGTKGSGSGGTKGSGSGGTKGSGSGGTKGSGSGGTKGSGSGGTKGSGSGGTKGSGSGGTKGSGSGGTKGSGSGGTKGSGSGGTKGCGSGGTKGSGSGGTSGSDGVDAKTSYEYQMGDPAEIDVSVTMTPEGTLFFIVRQNNFEGDEADIDGIMFNVADDSTLSELAIYPDENNPMQGELTDLQVDANGVTELSNGAGDGQAYDIGLQFGQVPDSVEGQVSQTNFTLSSTDGTPLTFEDIDLNSMKVIVNSEYEDGAVLGVSNSNNPDWAPADAGEDTPLTFDDIMGLMTQNVDEDEAQMPEEEPVEEEAEFI